MKRRGTMDWRTINKLARTRPSPRTATIKRVVQENIARTGRAPGDAEIAALLAIGVAHVQRHRRLLGL